MVAETGQDVIRTGCGAGAAGATIDGNGQIRRVDSTGNLTSLAAGLSVRDPIR
jgi:hypothetical protein